MSRQTNDKADRRDLVVFRIRRNTTCFECERALLRGSLLFKEGPKGLCLSCADLDHLDYLPAGNAALTRRASKHSRLRAVVVEWSRTRKRYERQGILVEARAIAKAEEECLADEELREARREREAERREQLNEQYVREFARRIRDEYPGCPAGEETGIAEHACLKYSGRVGRSAAAKEFSLEALELAVRAHIRHHHTEYDDLLARQYERRRAREKVGEKVATILEEWARPP